MDCLKICLHIVEIIYNRRRIKAEEKAKVVAAVLGTEFLLQDDFEEKE